MKRRTRLTVIVLLLSIGIIIGACSASDEIVREVPVEVTRVVTETVIEEGQTIEVTRIVAEEDSVMAEPTEAASAGSAVDGESAADTDIETLAEAETERPGSTNNSQTQRLIIKDGNMALIVMDSDTALEEAVDLAVVLGGYVISQRSWDDESGFRYATVRLAVPVDRFEEALRTLRTYGSVTDESASGQDVTDEYVDLNSRLGNLLATQERLRSFLEAADEVDEILDINEELQKVEEELDVIQGRMTYLADRAAYSTINLTINPLIPTATPSPTPTATPTYTPTPLPTPDEWRPGDTVHTALVNLENSSTSAADFTIYNGITCGPWLLLMSFIGYLFWRAFRWRVQRDTPNTPQPPLAGEPAGSD
ncbi:MAG: DUF4349 domain-containing protein [Candidatus Promineifilaceae bacterium]